MGDEYTAREIVRKIEEERITNEKGRKKIEVWYLADLAVVLRGKTVHTYFS
jgi:hypothetical protein